MRSGSQSSCRRRGALVRDRGLHGQARRWGGQQLEHRRRGHALLGVSFDVLGEVVGAHEAAVTNTTPEFLLAGVCAFVTGQLVRAGETTLAAVPRAAERTLTSVGPGVSFQVGRFEVVLAAAGVGALVETAARRRGWGHQPQRGSRQQCARHQHGRRGPRCQRHPARGRCRGRYPLLLAHFMPGHTLGVRGRHASLLHFRWRTGGLHTNRWHNLSLRRNVFCLRVTVSSVHFEFERFDYVHVHVLWRQRQRLGTAGAVLMRAHDDGGPRAGLRRRCAQQEARQLTASALAEFLLALRV